MKTSYKKAFVKLPLIFIFCFGILLLGCNFLEPDPTTSQKPKVESTTIVPLPDSRFNGYFWEPYGDSYGFYRFDGTNKVERSSRSSHFIYEFEVDNGKYHSRLWNNRYSEWSDWVEYNFSDDGKTLKLQSRYSDTIFYTYVSGIREEPGRLSDQRFDGEFSLDISGVVYGSGSHTYYFNRTTYAAHESFQYYASGSKSSYLAYEIEVANGQFRKRLRDNEYASWSSWESYRFDGDGDLWIGNLEYEKQW